MIYLKIRFFFVKKPLIPILCFSTNSLCNLRCRNCCNMCQYRTKELQFMDSFEVMKKTLDMLLAALDRVESIHLIGGEVMINKDFAKLLDYLQDSRQIGHILVITNGTIVPDADTTRALKQSKVTVYISNYTPAPELAGKLLFYELQEHFKKHGIRFRAQNPSYWYDPWIQISDPTKPPYRITRVGSRKDAEEAYRACECNKYFVHAFKGIIGTCNSMVMLPLAVPEVPFEDISVDLREKDKDISTAELTEKILYLLAKPVYDMCKYCHFPTRPKLVVPGEQIKD